MGLGYEEKRSVDWLFFVEPVSTRYESNMQQSTPVCLVDNYSNSNTVIVSKSNSNYAAKK